MDTEYTKIRVFFSKTGRARYISHLNLMDTVCRAVRRAGLRVKYTSGFNPRIYLTFALPLPLGVDGVCETFDLYADMADVSDFGRVGEMLRASLPESLGVIRVAAPLRPHTDIVRAAYEIDGDTAPLERFLGGDRAVVVRKSKKGDKEIDLKPCAGLSGGLLTLPAGNEFNVNPLLVTKAAGGGYDKITRVKIFCADGEIFE